MKLIVLNWLKDELIPFLGKVIEILFRIFLLILPMGVFLYVIQVRDKASTIRNISVYTNDNSVWQHIFPGFILVAIDPKGFKTSQSNLKNKLQAWVESNKYLLALLFMFVIVVMMALHEVP